MTQTVSILSDVPADNRRVQDILIAVAFLGLGLILANDAYDEYKEATDNLVALNECREEMACRIHEHRLTVTVPFQKCAMDMALGLVVPSPDYNGLCGFYKSLAWNSLSEAQEAADTYSNMMCVKPSDCRRQLDYFAGLTAVDSAYATARIKERSEETIRQLKVDAVQSVHAATFTNPSGVFGLIESAAGVYGYIQQQAFSNLSGSVSLLSYGAGGLFGGFRNGN